MNRLPLVLVAVLMITAIACGKKSSKSKSSIHRSTFFVQGNPESIVAGATMNATSFLTTSNVSMLNEYEVYSMYTFAEKSELIDEETTNIEEGNEAAEGNELLKERLSFTLRQDGDEYFYEHKDTKLGFRFSKGAGSTLRLDQVITENADYPAKVLHYSLKQNKEAFSFLISIKDTTGNNLIAFTFIKKKPQTLSLGSTFYRYLAGPGVRARWNKLTPVKIRLCSPPTASLDYKYRQGINMWSSALKDRLSYEVETVTSYPPFSDLNFHCLYNVTSYLTVAPETGHVNPAATVPQIDRSSGEIIDSDVLIFDSEIQKLGVSQNAYSRLSWVIAHGMGHFFGLDHQFDDSVKSIMSYDGTDYVTNYDLNAMWDRYK